jgi:hypothetical protein
MRIENTGGCEGRSATQNGRPGARRFAGKVQEDLRSSGERTPLACCFRWLAENQSAYRKASEQGRRNDPSADKGKAVR